MSSPRFEVVAPFQPAGDQPKAIAELAAGLRRGDKYQTLLGVTGSGKTMTLAHTIANYGKPTLVLSHNKTLAAQLYGELRQFLPAQRGRVLRLLLRLLPARGVRPVDRRLHREGRLDQPGHREPAAPRHLEPDGAGGRRHRRHGERHLRPGRPGRVPQADGHGLAGRAARARRDPRASWCASSTAGTTSPSSRAPSGCGATRSRSSRPTPSRPSGSSSGATRSSGSARSTRSPATPSPSSSSAPSTRPSTSSPSGPRSSGRSRRSGPSWRSGCSELKGPGKLLEAQRLESRTGVRHRDAARGGHLRRHRELLPPPDRPAGRASGPPVCFDYFPPDFLVVVDESHVTLPQIGGMFNGDRARKLTLVEYGFRLPSALDNRPLQFDEFMALVPQMINVSATPGDFELRLSQGVVVEQIIRPTGLVDPEVDIRPVRGQVDDLLNEIRVREARQRAGAGHHAHQADVGGSHRLSAAGRRAGALPALRHRRDRADGDPPRPPAGRLRRAGRHQPAARGARPARGLAGGDPRRRPGGLPPLATGRWCRRSAARRAT